MRRAIEAITAGAMSQGIDPVLVFQHLDDPDLTAYCDDPQLPDPVYAAAVARAVEAATARGTCSCERCKARRRGGP